MDPMHLIGIGLGLAAGNYATTYMTTYDLGMPAHLDRTVHQWLVLLVVWVLS